MREKRFLPYSSRNYNLNKSNKALALKVFKILRKEKNLIKNNKIKNIKFINIKKKIFKFGVKKIDYVEALNLDTLKKAKRPDESFNIFCAFYIGNVRLIDNF